MDNLHQGAGMTVQWTNDSGSDVSSGDLVLLGDAGLVGVAVHDIDSTDEGSVMLPPGVVVNFPVKGNDGSADAAVDAYDKVYFTDGEAFCDVDNTATLAGYTLESVSSGATTTVKVLLARA